jgi:hypothetical protein
MPPVPGTTERATAPVLDAMRTVMRPLVRLLIASGITYPVFAALLKGLFVEVADRHFRLDDAEPTDSRINLLTGVQRREIRRLRETAANDDAPPPAAVSFGAKLVAKWLSHPEYTDAEGEPVPLPRHAGDGAAVSFEGLVAEERTDIRPRVVLDEWLRLGIARLDEKNRVVLATDAFIPKDGAAELVYCFGRNLHDHAAAAADNLMGRPPRMERVVSYDALSLASVDKLDGQARQLGMKLLRSLNTSAMNFEAADAVTPQARHRFTCGVYVYAEPVDTDGKDRS